MNKSNKENKSKNNKKQTNKQTHRSIYLHCLYKYMLYWLHHASRCRFMMSTNLQPWQDTHMHHPTLNTSINIRNLSMFSNCDYIYLYTHREPGGLPDYFLLLWPIGGPRFEWTISTPEFVQLLLVDLSATTSTKRTIHEWRATTQA